MNQVYQCLSQVEISNWFVGYMCGNVGMNQRVHCLSKVDNSNKDSYKINMTESALSHVIMFCIADTAEVVVVSWS